MHTIFPQSSAVAYNNGRSSSAIQLQFSALGSLFSLCACTCQFSPFIAICWGTRFGMHLKLSIYVGGYFAQWLQFWSCSQFALFAEGWSIESSESSKSLVGDLRPYLIRPSRFEGSGPPRGFLSSPPQHGRAKNTRTLQRVWGGGQGDARVSSQELRTPKPESATVGKGTVLKYKDLKVQVGQLGDLVTSDVGTHLLLRTAWQFRAVLHLASPRHKKNKGFHLGCFSPMPRPHSICASASHTHTPSPPSLSLSLARSSLSMSFFILDGSLFLVHLDAIGSIYIYIYCLSVPVHPSRSVLPDPFVPARPRPFLPCPAPSRLSRPVPSCPVPSRPRPVPSVRPSIRPSVRLSQAPR